MMKSTVYQKKTSDFQLLSLQGSDKECLVSLFNDHKASQQEPNSTCYLVFKQHEPYFYSLIKQRIEAESLADLNAERCFPLETATSDSAVAEIEIDFPLALYRSAARHDIFNWLLTVKEQYNHFTFNLRLPLNDIAGDYELNDIAKLCIVAGADNLTLALDGKLNKQLESDIIFLTNLYKRFFVADSCGLICAGLTALPAMERVAALSREVLGDTWVDNGFLRFEC